MQPIINTNTDSFLIYEKHYAYEEVHRQGGFNGLTERVNVLLDAPSQTEREIKLQKGRGNVRHWRHIQGVFQSTSYLLHRITPP